MKIAMTALCLAKAEVDLHIYLCPSQFTSNISY